MTPDLFSFGIEEYLGRDHPDLESFGSVIVFMYVDEKDVCFALVLPGKSLQNRRHFFAGDAGPGAKVDDRRPAGHKRLIYDHRLGRRKFGVNSGNCHYKNSDYPEKSFHKVPSPLTTAA